MKLMILHLSDIHFEKENKNIEMYAKRILGALYSHGRVDKVLLVLSGDVAYSGKKSQYEMAEKFLTVIGDEYKNRGIDIVYAIVPGNHDVNYNVKKCSSGDEYSQEKKKMSACLNFLKKYDCFEQNWLYDNKIISDDTGKKIKVHLLNTAPFSALTDDKGKHKYSEDVVNKMKSEMGDSDLEISIMHHSIHWFDWETKRNLEKLLYQKNDLILFGHDHYEEEYIVEAGKNTARLIQGGELANRDNWGESTFGVHIINTSEMEISSYIYNLVNDDIYVTDRENLSEKIGNNIRNKYDLYPLQAYRNKLFADTKYKIASSCLEYFVFPTLEEEDSDNNHLKKEFDEEKSFITEIEQRKCVSLQGYKDGSKTMLAKYLFSYFFDRRVTLFIDMADIYGGTAEEIIKRTFREIYGDNKMDLERFRQVPNMEKVIILDNYDYSSDYNNKLISEILDCFGIVITTSKKDINFDIEELVEKKVIGPQLHVYNILPFYKDKRKRLIEKIANLLVTDNSTAIEEYVVELCNTLDAQKSSFKNNPDFIVQYTKYYCSNIGIAMVNEGDVFNKVFEANIVSLIHPFAKDISVDKVMIIADRLAYKMNRLRRSPLDQKDVFEIVDEYNSQFDSDVSYEKIISILKNANIIEEDSTGYLFRERNYLAYFAAREIKRKCLEENDYKDLNHLLEYACYGINADILLFVTYISDNRNIITMILEKAEQCCGEWNAFTINPLNIEYISSEHNIVQRIEHNEKERVKKETEQQEIEKEKKLEKKERLSDYKSKNIYNYQEVMNTQNEIIRACSLMMLLTKILPNFEHMMPGAEKDRCVTLLYSMPLKLFYCWAKEVDGKREEIVSNLISIINTYYIEDEAKQVSEKDVIRLMRTHSIILLLDLMNVSLSESTRRNTKRYLDKFEYQTNDLYQIEHLMSLDKRDSCNDFIEEAIASFDATNNYLKKELIQRVARHFVVSSSKIKRAQIDKLNTKLWNGAVNRGSQAMLKLEKERNNKRIR